MGVVKVNNDCEKMSRFKTSKYKNAFSHVYKKEVSWKYSFASDQANFSDNSFSLVLDKRPGCWFEPSF